MKSFTTAISLLSILPVPERWTRNISSSTIYFPLAGMIIGAIYYLISIGLIRAGIQDQWLTIAVLTAMIVLTRAFHMDGLADMADGFWGGSTKEQILRIMKDSATGVFGVIALVILLLTKWTSLNFLIKGNTFWILISAAMVSRFSMVVLSGWLPYARKEGTGHAIISHTTWKHVFISLAYFVPLMLFIFGPGSLVLILIGALVSGIIGYFSRIKISGVTGDVLGATCEIVETLLLAITPFLQSYFFPDYWVSPLLVYI